MMLFLLDVLAGVFLSSFVQLVGGWYLHFLPTVAVVHALALGVTYGLLRAVMRRFVPGKRIGFWLLTFFAACYVYTWLIYSSLLLTLPLLKRSIYSLLLVLVFLGTAELLRWVLQQLLPGRRNGLSVTVLLALLVILLAGKGFVLGVVPVSMVDQMALRVNPITSSEGPSAVLRRTMFPFSVSMEDGLERFDWLLGRTPGSDDRHTLVLVLDTMRQDALGAKVGSVDVTPTIDKLRTNGLDFENYYVQATWTKPSTASLFTGLYVRDHGTLYGWKPDPNETTEPQFYGQVLPDRFRTLAERLRENGVETFGSVSISHISSRYGFDQGFDSWFDPLPTSNERDDYAGVQRQLFWLHRRNPTRSFSYLHMTGPHYPFAVSSYNLRYWKQTKFYSDKGLRVPGEGLPHPKDVSPQALPAREDLTRDQIEFVRHLYRSKLNLYDRKIVRPLIEGLRASGSLSATDVVVTADHGEELFDHRRFGHVRNMRESVISPPLVIRKGDRERGKRSKQILESLDLAATILDWHDANRQGISGSSFAGEVGLDEDTGVALAEMGQRLSLSSSVTRERIDIEPGSFGVNVAMIRQGPWKLYHQYGRDRDVLINLPRDPAERRAVTDRPDVTRSLRKKIFSTLGSDSSFRTPLGPMIKADEQELQNLEGLGYL